MFVPNLEVGMRLVHGERQHELVAGPHAHHGLHAVAFVGLSFRPRTDAAALPRNGDASGLILAAPCDEDDTTCLDELAESQPEFSSLRGDTP
jgi:hypothetical protein